MKNNQSTHITQPIIVTYSHVRSNHEYYIAWHGEIEKLHHAEKIRQHLLNLLVQRLDKHCTVDTYIDKNGIEIHQLTLPGVSIPLEDWEKETGLVID